MATEIVMPNMGFDTQEARLIEWLKQPGDTVKKGDLIAVIESDKANVELESKTIGFVNQANLWIDGRTADRLDLLYVRPRAVVVDVPSRLQRVGPLVVDPQSVTSCVLPRTARAPADKDVVVEAIVAPLDGGQTRHAGRVRRMKRGLPIRLGPADELSHEQIVRISAAFGHVQQADARQEHIVIHQEGTVIHFDEQVLGGIFVE